jgi:soluble cytochrome b562
MKSIILPALVAACLAITLPATAEDTELGARMDAMNEAYKALRKETDPAKAAEHARVAQAEAAKSMLETPAMLAKMPVGPERAKATLEYRKAMARLYMTLCEVEEACLANDLEAVKALIEELKKQRKAGHDRFIEEEEE